MPFWYILVCLLTLAEVLFQWHQSSLLPIWIATSAVLWALASVYSITALVRNQQPYCILGKGHPTCRLEDISEQHLGCFRD
jgi:uncharacterized integral membrane protein